MGMGRRFCPLLLFEIVHAAEIIFTRLAELERPLIGDTHHFQGVMVDPSFDVPVRDAINLYLAAGPLVTGGIVVVGKMGDGNLDGNELILVVLLLI